MVSRMSITIDPAIIESDLRACAAQYIIPRFRNLRAEEVETKSSADDLVTIADKEMEIALTDILRRRYPDCVVIGEEAVAQGTCDLSALSDPKATVFVLDPVDGTWNFRHGKEQFGSMAACVIGGETRFGWILDVLKGDMYFAAKRQGAFINGSKIAVPPKPERALKDLTGYAYFSHEFRQQAKAKKAEIGKVTSLRCAAHEYMTLLAGGADFSISTNPKPWDHLAGVLLLQEAGGVAARWSGAEYTPDSCDGILVAGSQHTWDQIHGLFLADAPQKTVATGFIL
jgi:fructose-1,6-bisphosphatase/inositol monophosphatase family enzyme